MIDITVPTAQLAAALHCAAKNDVRYYLNGVFLDAKSGCVVTTNGHVLYVSAPKQAVGITEDVILPRDFVEGVVKDAKKAEIVTITFDGRALSTATRRAIAVDGRFPDWRCVYPEQLSGEPAQFDKERLMLGAKANKALGVRACGGYPVYANGKNGAVGVLAGGAAHFIIMPMNETIKAPFATFTRFGV